MAIDTALELACKLARCADKHKAEDVVVLDVSNQHSLIDAFVVVTARNAKHAALIAEEATKLVKGLGHRGVHREPANDWVCCDFIDVVVQVFTPTARAYYDFESLWADAARVAWQPAADAVTA